MCHQQDQIAIDTARTEVYRLSLPIRLDADNGSVFDFICCRAFVLQED
jgi:hypothetical protein